MLFDLHKEIDGLREAELKGGKIGTTKRGIGPAYASKATRNGVRCGELKDLSSFADKLRRLVTLQPLGPPSLGCVEPCTSFLLCCLRCRAMLPCCLPGTAQDRH